MKLLTIALDFDGAIAQNDKLDPFVREAIADVREKGIAVILVTGRILDDLRRVAGQLHFVDAVVAENGAVIEFPASGYRRTLGPAPDSAFLADLQNAPASALDGHLRRGDFSRWIAGVFGDYPLAKTIREIEDSYRTERFQTVGPNIAETVRARYELIDPAAERDTAALTAKV